MRLRSTHTSYINFICDCGECARTLHGFCWKYIQRDYIVVSALLVDTIVKYGGEECDHSVVYRVLHVVRDTFIRFHGKLIRVTRVFFSRTLYVRLHCTQWARRRWWPHGVECGVEMNESQYVVHVAERNESIKTYLFLAISVSARNTSWILGSPQPDRVEDRA